jgi:hypothetical protein
MARKKHAKVALGKAKRAHRLADGKRVLALKH